MVQAMKAARHNDARAKKEHAKRRALFFDSLQRQQEDLEDIVLEDLLISNFQRKCHGEIPLDFYVSKPETYGEVISENRKLREEMYDAKKKESFEVLIKQDPWPQVAQLGPPWRPNSIGRSIHQQNAFRM